MVRERVRPSLTEFEDRLLPNSLAQFLGQTLLYPSWLPIGDQAFVGPNPLLPRSQLRSASLSDSINTAQGSAVQLKNSWLMSTPFPNAGQNGSSGFSNHGFNESTAGSREEVTRLSENQEPVFPTGFEALQGLLENYSGSERHIVSHSSGDAKPGNRPSLLEANEEAMPHRSGASVPTNTHNPVGRGSLPSLPASGFVNPINLHPLRNTGYDRMLWIAG